MQRQARLRAPRHELIITHILNHESVDYGRLHDKTRSGMAQIISPISKMSSVRRLGMVCDGGLGVLASFIPAACATRLAGLQLTRKTCFLHVRAVWNYRSLNSCSIGQSATEVFLASEATQCKGWAIAMVPGIGYHSSLPATL